MFGKILPVLLFVVGLGAGAGSAWFSRHAEGPSSEALRHDQSKDEGSANSASELGASGVEKDEFEYLPLTKQFVVPVVKRDRISALVTLSLSLEATPGIGEAFYAIEPKLRDGFLQVLFDYANMGGFDGAFTQSDRLDSLRKDLLKVAQGEMGTDVTRVLILSIARQST